MVLRILKYVGAAMVLSLIALWLWQGGYWKIAEYAEIVPNPLNVATTSLADYTLPGQPDLWQVPDTTSTEDEMEYGAVDYQNPYDALYFDDSTYAIPSTDRSVYAGSATLQIGEARNTDPNKEFLVVTASGPNSIDISGWSIRSAVTGERRVIPLAAAPFIQGVINSVTAITLSPGDYVILTSGPSPVGVSFRESICTGYLAQTQTFSPTLANACPRPGDLLPRTAENESRYGADCLDYIVRIPQCSYPKLLPSTLSAQCRAFLANTFTYTGCVQSYSSATMLNVWRAYFASAYELWRNSRDMLQLLDAEGRVVDTITY